MCTSLFTQQFERLSVGAFDGSLIGYRAGVFEGAPATLILFCFYFISLLLRVLGKISPSPDEAATPRNALGEWMSFWPILPLLGLFKHLIVVNLLKAEVFFL